MSATRRAATAIGILGGVAGIAAGRSLRHFYRDLVPTTGEDEQFAVTTDDGWRLALFHYAARGPAKAVPVVLGHGFAGSRLIWDLTPETSLARYLAQAGYDVYALDLRGRGDSWPVDGTRQDTQWSFDDFVHLDLPAAVEAACQRSGAEQAYWLGLEMSGQALYAAAISGTAPRLRGGVTFGSPTLTPASAKVPGVTTQPRGRRGGRVQFRSGAHHAGPILALLRSKQLETSFRPSNTDPLVPARYLRHGVPDEATLLADQFTDWIDHNTMRTLDHRVAWSEHLSEMRLPVLVMAGARDLQRPAWAVRRTAEALGSEDKTYLEAGVESGFSVDFGHDDLVAGRASRTEVFPKVVSWLDGHLDGAARSAASPEA